MDCRDPLEQLQNVELEEKLKGQIIAQAQAVYGPQLPNGIRLEVVSTVHQTDNWGFCSCDHVAHLIVYTKPGSFTQWEMLMQSEKSGSARDALSELLVALKLKLGEKMASMTPKEPSAIASVVTPTAIVNMPPRTAFSDGQARPVALDSEWQTKFNILFENFPYDAPLSESFCQTRGEE